MPNSLHDEANPLTFPPISESMSVPLSMPVPLGGVEVTYDETEGSWDLWKRAIADRDSVAQPATADTQPVAPDPELATQPMALENKAADRRKDDAVALIGQRHHKVAAAIRATWGFRECPAFIMKLILSGRDDLAPDLGSFSPRVIEALIALSETHEAEFGPFDNPQEQGFGDFSVRSGLDGVR
jgi:hypothetical protein